ncbi:MAG: hypothetical protein JW812_02120 [Alphaproteobacteria bacterium]|nr:hypothetical protein [Alphaproteobacteria bacterium]MBN2779567.1 hypothetical protein [Alphaproteobacteria bacterium]
MEKQEDRDYSMRRVAFVGNIFMSYTGMKAKEVATALKKVDGAEAPMAKK